MININIMYNIKSVEQRLFESSAILLISAGPFHLRMRPKSNPLSPYESDCRWLTNLSRSGRHRREK